MPTNSRAIRPAAAAADECLTAPQPQVGAVDAEHTAGLHADHAPELVHTLRSQQGLGYLQQAGLKRRGLALLGHVASDRLQQRRPAGAPQHIAAQLEHAATALAQHRLAFVDLGNRLAVEGELRQQHRRLIVGWRQHVAQRDAALHVFYRVAAELAGRAVGCDHAPLAVVEDDDVIGLLEQFTEVFERLVSPLSLGRTKWTATPDAV